MYHCPTDKQSVDNEIHFLFDCENNKLHRKIFFENVNIELSHISLLSKFEKIDLFKKLLFEPQSKEDLICLARFIYYSEQQR